MKPIIAITMGDPAGIGPEITAKALSGPELHTLCRPVVIGDKAVMERAAGIVGVTARIRGISDIGQAEFAPGTIEVLDLKNVPADLPFGKVDARAGQAAYDYVKTAVELAMAGAVPAIATAPINKEALNLAGCPHPGHTEILAALSGTTQYAMMLSTQALKVIHVTTHVSMRKACDLITKDRVLRTILLAQDTLLKMGMARPRIGVAGLNAHAGESGMFGDEEIKHIAPAVQEARALGIEAIGPVPPDTVFYRAIRLGEFDMVVVMYHDQGHIPIKLLGFESGVNITVGLPFIRTSVDHGTAFDKAGKGTAESSSMVEAVRLATRMTGQTDPQLQQKQGETSCR
ncbi:MAG: 4-hydroxythreonine-4-phosphate dehydrogenase PdxA [Solidesulfovibrio sp.]